MVVAGARFVSIVALSYATALLAQMVPAGAHLAALGAEAAQRALELRGLSEKGAAPRKKKALTDLLKALQEAGVSRRRSAVPADQRSVHSWFAQVGLASLSMC